MEVELCEVEFKIYQSKNCMCNIVEFQMNGSEIDNKLSEIILHYLNFA